VCRDVAPVGEGCIVVMSAALMACGGDDLIEEVGSLLIERKISPAHRRLTKQVRYRSSLPDSQTQDLYATCFVSRR